MDKIRKRSSYNNLKSYDDELDIVRELLENAEQVEDELTKEFEGILRELCRLYEEWFPFYYPRNVLNKEEFQKLTYSLNYDIMNTEIQEVLDEIREKVEQLQVNRLMAWLILDYELTAQKTAESIGVKYNNNLVSSTFKKELILKPWVDDHKTFLDRIRDNTRDMDSKLRYVILEGIKNGWSIKKMSETFRTITGIAAYKAARLVRTETMAVYSKATKEMFLENGIEYVEIIGDAACGGICLDYVGEALPLSEAEIGDDLPPYHPNCACSFCAYTEFEDKNSSADY